MGKMCNYQDLQKSDGDMGRTGKSMFRIFCQVRFLTALMVGGLLWHASAPPASAQYFYEWLGMITPVFSLSNPKGEIQCRLVYLTIASGTETIPRLNVSRSLRADYGLTSSRLFLDWMARIQAGRFSLRANLDFVDFSGSRPYLNRPGQGRADARFEYSGFRLGGDFDIVQWYESRVGVNMDYDLHNAFFTESIYTSGGGKKLSTPGPITVGAYAVLNPNVNFMGVTGVVEGRARWTVAGPPLTEWEVAAGLRSAETLFGSLAVRGGFRSTSIEFQDNISAINAVYPTKVDLVLDGWFGELVYYY